MYSVCWGIKKCMGKTVKVSTLVNNFKATGHCPFNCSAIWDELLAPAAMYEE